MVNYGWSIKRYTWDNAPEMMPHATSWQTIPFNINQIINMKRSPGIYIISMNSLYFNKNYTVPIYVGESKNLYDRFSYHIKGHFKDSMMKRIKKDLNYKPLGDIFKVQYSFTYMPRVSMQNRKKCEQYLINVYGPKFNRINSTTGVREEEVKLNAFSKNKYLI